MPVIMKLTLPGGRYHATPWGRHVNEGVPEWPPSPWRLLRALVAVWKRTCPSIPEEAVRRILAALVDPPRFSLPPHRIAHTRHYMPWEKKNPSDRTLVFDTFVSVARNADLYIGWPNTNLSDADRVLLEMLLHNLGSLGRAESWVDVDLADEQPSWNCDPTVESDLNSWPVFCPDPASVFDDESYPTHDAKKLAKGKINPAAFLFDCPRWHLCLDTESLHERRWSKMPGARWINYTRPPEPAAALLRHRSRTGVKPTVLQFVLDGPVLPLATETVRVAEALRRAAMSQFGLWCRRHPDESALYRRADSSGLFGSPALSGKDADGNLLPGDGHAYYLPLPSREDRHRLRLVTVCARDGFSEAEVAALYSIRQLRLSDDDAGLLRTQVVGLGQRTDFPDAIMARSCEWYSVTPYLGPLHIGQHAQDRYLRKALRREWRRCAEYVPEYRGVELLRIDPLASDQPPWLGAPLPYLFCRTRWKHRQEKYRPARIYRLHFSQPVSGPICLGYSCHFGLGLFTAAERH